MSPNAPARFQWRAFVTLFVTLSFVVIAASGLRGDLRPTPLLAWSGVSA